MDNLAKPEIRLFRWHLSAFQAFGYTGLGLAILTTMILIVLLGLSPWVMVGVIGIAILTFSGLAMVTKIITGEEQLIYYHHEIAIMIMATIFLKMMNQPILPYLDITILGIGAFLVCGRVGCLMVGCCHGRPNELGVCYRKEHASAGFPNYLVGVRLFPIQAVESLWVFGVVLTGLIFMLTGSLPGEVLAWYVITYGIGRSCFESARGDTARPYHWGFSAAQWTSVILMCAIVCAELAGMLPLHTWHIVPSAAMILTMVAVASARRFGQTVRYKLLDPRHVREIAEAIDRISSGVSERKFITGGHTVPEVIPLSSTSLGIQISAGKIKDADRFIEHYALSSQNGSLGEEAARSVADLIVQMKPLSGVNKLVTGGNGVFHLLIHPLSAGDQG